VLKVNSIKSRNSTNKQVFCFELSPLPCPPPSSGFGMGEKWDFYTIKIKKAFDQRSTFFSSDEGSNHNLWKPSFMIIPQKARDSNYEQLKKLKKFR